MSSGKPRTCIASLRGINRLAAWCSNYEFEDVAANVDGADLCVLEPGRTFTPSSWVVARLLWRPVVRHVGRHMNPGLKQIALTQDYDLFVFICMNPFDLLFLNGIPEWRKRAKTAVCYISELYAGTVNEYEFLLRTLRDFDHVLLSHSGTVEATQRVVERPCHHVALATDVMRFTPLPDWPARCIDVYSMGRRAEWAHEELLAMSEARELFYMYDTIPSKMMRPPNHDQHRSLIANIAKRSRYFVAYPAKVTNDDETRGQSEVGARFFEGVAAGAVLVGGAPSTPTFQRDFGWPDAVLPIRDADDLRGLIREARSGSARLETVAKRNAVEALRRHDWVHRWRQVLEIAGLKPTERHLERERRLNALADSAG